MRIGPRAQARQARSPARSQPPRGARPGSRASSRVGGGRGVFGRPGGLGARGGREGEREGEGEKTAKSGGRAYPGAAAVRAFLLQGRYRVGG